MPVKIPLSEGYLLVDSTKCSGCHNCMLACSLVHEGKTSLSLSRIQVIQDVLERFPEDIVMVTFPVTFNGRERQVHGAFAPVIWENMTEPILGGREQIGWSKIYADIEPPVVMGNSVHCTAGWYGFKFLDLKIDNLHQLTAEELKARQEAMASQTSEGSIHWKYIPKTGHPGEADADYLTISTNKGAPPTEVKSFAVWTGDGSIEFHRATWEDLPTQVHVVNAFADMEIKRVVSAAVTKTESIGGGMGQTLILE